jgi:hypothetical protein
LLLDTLKFLMKKLRFPFSFTTVPLIGCTKALTFEWVWRGCRVDLSRKATSRIGYRAGEPSLQAAQATPGPLLQVDPNLVKLDHTPLLELFITFQISPICL